MSQTDPSRVGTDNLTNPQLHRLLQRRQRLVDEYDDLLGTEVRRELSRLHRIAYCVDVNCEKLSTRAEWYRENEGTWGDDRVMYRRWFDKEYSRLFHNVVTSIYTITNHMQRLVSKYGRDGFSHRYSKKVSHYTIDDQAEFLTQLRHYTQKRRMPSLRRRSVSKGTSPIVRSVVIKKEDLIDWDQWNKQAREYLLTLDDNVNITKEVESYRESLHYFYYWFEPAFQDIYSRELEVSYLMEDDFMHYDPRLITEAVWAQGES